MRVRLLIVILAALPLFSAFAQSSPPSPIVVISPPSGDLAASHRARVTGLPPNASLVAVLFSPSGDQQVAHVQSDAAGTVDLGLQAPSGGWQAGLYRLVVGLPGGQSVSGAFVASDGAPHLYAEPFLPSPTSAFNFVGTGLPANSSVRLAVLLTGGQQGKVDLRATTDASGAFSIFLWPQQAGVPFFAAGAYRVLAPDLNLATDFDVREHPVSATASVVGPVLPGAPVQFHFEHYARDRYLWGVYATRDGQMAGEFLLGPTDARGSVDAAVLLQNLSPGQYVLATPYDWGETGFDVTQPPPTDTPTATPTTTPDPRPTAAPTARPPAGASHKHKKKRPAKRRAAATPTPIPWHP